MWLIMLLLREHPASAFLFQTASCLRSSCSVITKIPGGQDAARWPWLAAGSPSPSRPPPKDEAGRLRGEGLLHSSSLLLLGPRGGCRSMLGPVPRGYLPSLTDFPQPCPTFVNRPCLRISPISVSVCRTCPHTARHVKPGFLLWAKGGSDPGGFRWGTVGFSGPRNHLAMDCRPLGGRFPVVRPALCSLRASRLGAAARTSLLNEFGNHETRVTLEL